MITEYGFRNVQTDTHRLRYESDSIFVNILHGRTSFEIRLSLGQLDDLYEGQEREFYLPELIRLADPQFKDDPGLMQASTADAVKRLVTKLAVLARKSAPDFLAGNVKRFSELSDFREKETAQYALETRLSHIRADVEIAWKENDFARVIELLQPVAEHLESGELKKLEYCRNHIPA